MKWAGSSSANADVFIGASYTIQENNRRVWVTNHHQSTPFLKAAWWQIRAHQLLQADRFCGDELVLVCTRAKAYYASNPDRNRARHSGEPTEKAFHVKQGQGAEHQRDSSGAR